MLPYYMIYNDWDEDMIEKRNAGVELKEIAAQVQVFSSLHRITY
jgi:hypothetical protein